MKAVELSPAEQDQEIKEVLSSAFASMEENFIALVDKPVVLKSREAGVVLREELLEAFENQASPCMVGTIGKSYSGKILLIVNLADAITCACYLGMIPDDVTKDRRKELSFSEEDQESFGEVGNILYSAVDEVFRNKLSKPSSFRLENAPVLEVGKNDNEVLEGDEFYVHNLQIKIGDFPDGECLLVMTRELGEGMNQGTLVEEDSEPEEGDDLPDEIDGELAVFALQKSTNKLAKAVATRFKMKLTVRPPGTVPNPSNLKGKMVLIEIPEDGEQYFQWCARLKKGGDETAVVAALEWPTKHCVLMAYNAGVDQILGLPAEMPDLAKRLIRIEKDRAERALAEAEEQGAAASEDEAAGGEEE